MYEYTEIKDFMRFVMNFEGEFNLIFNRAYYNGVLIAIYNSKDL